MRRSRLNFRAALLLSAACLAVPAACVDLSGRWTLTTTYVEGYAITPVGAGNTHYNGVCMSPRRGVRQCAQACVAWCVRVSVCEMWLCVTED